MAQSLWLWLLVLASSGSGTALLDLTGVQEIEGTWRASVRLPCVYEPSADFTQETVLWKASLTDHAMRTIFRRDPISGSQTLLTLFKNRICVPKDPPGDVSLLIEALEMSDRGQYTCEVVWAARNKSRVANERTTVLRVVKVAVTKPVITAGSSGSTLPRGRNASLACHANGSPPITYRWFKAGQRGTEDQVGQDALLRFDSLQASDAGTYFCEVRNRVGSAVQRSNAFLLTVKDPSESPPLRPGPEDADATVARTDQAPTSLRPWGDGGISEHQEVIPAPQATSLPLYIIVLVAVLCVVAFLVVLAVVLCRRKPRPGNTYEVTYNRPAAVTREEPEQVTPRVENNYTVEPTTFPEYVLMDGKLDNEYEILTLRMESEYEVADYKLGGGEAMWKPRR